MRISIAGATGAIGERLVQKLRQKTDHVIRILSRRQIIANYVVADVKTVNANLRHIDDLIRATKGVYAIIYLAAITHTHEQSLYDEIDHRGTEKLIQAAKDSGVRRFMFLTARQRLFMAEGMPNQRFSLKKA